MHAVPSSASVRFLVTGCTISLTPGPLTFGGPGAQWHVTLEHTIDIGRRHCTESSSQQPLTFNNLCWSYSDISDSYGTCISYCQDENEHVHQFISLS